MLLDHFHITPSSVQNMAKPVSPNVAKAIQSPGDTTQLSRS